MSGTSAEHPVTSLQVKKKKKNKNQKQNINRTHKHEIDPHAAPQLQLMHQAINNQPYWVHTR